MSLAESFSHMSLAEALTISASSLAMASGLVPFGKNEERALAVLTGGEYFLLNRAECCAFFSYSRAENGITRKGSLWSH